MAERVFRILSREKRQLPVKLTEAEFKAAAKRAAKIADEIAATDGEIEGYASSIKGLKARKETLNVEREAQSRIVRDETEDRQVEVVVEVDEQTRTVYERRTDTNEILKERGLTAAEAQIAMFDPPPGETTPPVEPEESEKDVTPQKALPAPKKKKKGGRRVKEPSIEDLDAEDDDEDLEADDP